MIETDFWNVLLNVNMYHKRSLDYATAYKEGNLSFYSLLWKTESYKQKKAEILTTKLAKKQSPDTFSLVME